MPRTLPAKHAESRFHELVGDVREIISELKLLTMDFPHLRESFDKDDLPIAFLLKRGADRAKARTAKGPKSKTKAAPAKAPRRATRKR
jgi:hypothetical protein